MSAPTRIRFTYWDYKSIPETDPRRFELLDGELVMVPAFSMARDRGYKRTLYARHGVKEYWLVDPEKQTLEVYTLTPKGLERVASYQRGQTARSPLLGLEFPVDQVFAEW